MSATCVGHNCVERRYRANGITATSKNLTKGKNAEACGAPGKDKDAITEVTNALNAQIDPDDVDKEECPEGCKCNLPAWPTTWDTLEKGLTYTRKGGDLECQFEVTLTYNYESQERSAECYRAPPPAKPK